MDGFDYDWSIRSRSVVKHMINDKSFNKYLRYQLNFVCRIKQLNATKNNLLIMIFEELVFI